VVEAETDAGVTFDFHDADGRLAGSVRAPDRDPRIPPYFRGDHIYVVTRDPDFAVQGVAAYRITRAPPDP
jgi:hypothetical protein